VPEIDLFAVQPYVTAETYRSEGAFREAAFRLGRRCVERRAGSEVPALAVFPENFATYLALMPLGRLGRHLPSADLAAALAIAARPAALARALRRVGLRRAKIAALLALAPEVRDTWERCFSDLARETGMSLVAGSALVPADDGERVYNLSLTFAPDGRVVASTCKVNLVPQMEDVLGLTPGDASALAPVELPVGAVGTLICYDGFAVPHTRRESGWRAVGGSLAASGARIVAQPSANPWPWEGPWVHAEPGSPMLRREQWRAEGLEAQLRSMEGVRYAVTAHLVGRVLDQRFDGRSAIYDRRRDGRVVTLAEADAATLSPDSEQVVHARVERDW